ncbi:MULTISPECIES: helix-turn-helix domain-containing protein [unclassified Enterobacter]|uniref:GlxA family transcriptional regulator n=1 Tax=unclassified Enterobacter TaxID=2608935 RepID=UPI0015CE73AD|nr:MULTISPECIES: helix-turn-helix domain-containing protein [unclassified Enterobacter]MBB3307931.1 transcriptional regulator GlxA family with amidase domain [Enterobacter sp. Sphag1F]NYI16743.1 transcriptional regulator GlxA family with amidase domain [Enterobacter sp. Sphag71]
MTNSVQFAPKMPGTAAPIKVGIVVFDDIIPFHLSVPCAVFEKAAQDDGALCYQLLICATHPGPLKTNSGFSILAEHGLDQLADVDVVVVPSWSDPDVLPPAELLHALQQAAQRGAQVVGLCLGAFVLGAAGLLSQRRATTHWRWMADFERLYPDVAIDRDVLYIDEGQIVTSAGTAASIDCCLHLVREQCGVDVANSVARMLVVPPHRQGGQAQYIEQPVYHSAGNDRFMSALSWATENLQQALTLEQLADKALMSRRSFTRRFNQTTGGCFSTWLVNQRLALAQRFLEKTDQPVELIAEKAGFSSPLMLRRHFKKQLNTSPLQYRKTFRGRS